MRRIIAVLLALFLSVLLYICVSPIVGWCVSGDFDLTSFDLTTQNLIMVECAGQVYQISLPPGADYHFFVDGFVDGFCRHIESIR